MDLTELIKINEGLRLKPYKCPAGKWTIAYGRNLDDRGISEREAEFMLENDIALAKTDLRVVFGDLTDKWTENRRNALTDMMFNLGLTRFMGFVKMIKAIEVDDWDEAARQALDSRWAEQVGMRAEADAKYLKEG